MKLAEVLKAHEEPILKAWIQEQLKVIGSKMSADELGSQCKEFLKLLVAAVNSGETNVEQGKQWEPVRRMLNTISRSRGAQGFSPTQTATFVFSLKLPVFNVLRKEFGSDAQALANEVWTTTMLLDSLGLMTSESYLKTREELIIRQQEEMLELSTPVVKLWNGILALPMIGTLDSSRTQVVMESLLQKIMETGSEVAIIDITGVPTVDTLVAQHLIKTVTAARLMGAECIISGIRPQIAATIVHLGVDLGDVITKASLADAFVVALGKLKKNMTAASARNAKASANMAQVHNPGEVRA